MSAAPAVPFTIDGATELIAHVGFPTHAFKAPMIWNPYLESIGANAVVVPMACRAEAFAPLMRSLFALDNLRGALITMPHKVSVVALLDEASPAVRIAGACNAVRRLPDGRLSGGMFDGEGFVRGLRRKGVRLEGARALVVGCGGVGSAIAASLAGAGVGAIALHDVRAGAADALAGRLREHYPRLEVSTGDADPTGRDVVVNGTPLGMSPDDPLPIDPSRLAPGTVVGEVVMRTEATPLVEAARERGCTVQVGTDMLFEMIPPYLEFFGLPTTTPATLRALARLPGTA